MIELCADVKKLLADNEEDRIRRAVKRQRNAEREYRRASEAWAVSGRVEADRAKERLARAGDRYAVARTRLYQIVGLRLP